MLLRLGDKMMIADRMPGGAPGPAYGVSGWGMPRWASPLNMSLEMKPTPVGARYFCGDDYPMYQAQTEPCAMGNMYDSTRMAYQEAVTAHYTQNHPDLHYPIDQNLIDAHAAAKRKAHSKMVLLEQLSEIGVRLTKKEAEKLHSWQDKGVGGGTDFSSSFQPVTRPRELPDFTEFDFPDANVADAGTEEIELDQLISIQARQGRRFLGVEIQNIGSEMGSEFLTATDNADLQIVGDLQLNTRTGGHNLDDPENIWRMLFRRDVANIEATAGTGTAIVIDTIERNDAPPGGQVYVAPRLFWRFSNDMDRQVDIGDLFVRIATVDQRLSTFLLFELLEQYSGLFGLT